MLINFFLKKSMTFESQTNLEAKFSRVGEESMNDYKLFLKFCDCLLVPLCTGSKFKFHRSIEKR